MIIWIIFKIDKKILRKACKKNILNKTNNNWKNEGPNLKDEKNKRGEIEKKFQNYKLFKIKWMVIKRTLIKCE